MEIKAIETKYKGYRFRSRLEARWAVFFDALGIEWEYEFEGFELSDGSRYLPDFWFPKLNLFIEIKGVKATQEEVTKGKLLSKESGKPVLFAIGSPASQELWGIASHNKQIVGLLFIFIEWLRTNSYAKQKSLSARFEFGENG